VTTFAALADVIDCCPKFRLNGEIVIFAGSGNTPSYGGPTWYGAPMSSGAPPTDSTWFWGTGTNGTIDPANMVWGTGGATIIDPMAVLLQGEN
jgi:hypothetical protein